MPTENTATTQKVYLETFKDWGNWDKAFKMRANSARIWQLVNPDSTEQPMQRPIRPLVSSYFRRIPPQLIEPDRPRQTRGSEGQGSSQTLTPIYTPETTDPNLRAQHISELTAEDKASFQSERKDYDQDYREFEQEQARINKMKDWMMDTVTTGLMNSAVDPEQDLRSWYTNLRDSVGATTAEQKAEARLKYQKALAAVPKAAKDFPRWITDWEQATHLAQTKGIGGLDSPLVWFDDLSKAIRPVLGNWVSNYRGIYRKELRAESLTIQEVAKDLRAEVDSQDNQQPAKKTTTTRVTRGAFGPTFGNDPDPADQPDPDQEDQQPAGSSGSKRSSKKRKSEQQPESKSKKSDTKGAQGKDSSSCDACGGHHKLDSCYYAFPSEAPSWFRGNPVLKEAVTRRLANNQALIDKVTALQGSAGPSKSD